VRKLFGTDGVRGVAGVDLTAELARDIGAAAVAWAGPGARVVIGRDTRESGPMLEDALVEGIVSAGGAALRAGVIPTPAVAMLTHQEGAELGCVISASHNPYEDNGIKFMGADGRKLHDEDELAVEALVGRAPAAAGGKDGELADADGRYEAWLIETYGAGMPAWEVVLDCANGAAHAVGPEVIGRVARLVGTLGTDPDGRNINAGVGSTHLDAVAAAVRRRGAACGLAFDGDADRCLAVDATGEVVDGDQIMAILALAMRECGELVADTLVATVMSNLGLHLAMREHGVVVRTTPVGDRYVLAALTAGGFSLGGEQSGHVVLPGYATTGDGLLTALRLMARMVSSGRSLADLAAVLTRLPQVLVNVAVADKTAVATAPAVATAIAGAEAELGEAGRVLLRPSGTEPLVRVMVEAPTESTARTIAHRIATVVAAS
jgi:phosphoglucosamine mutase